MLKLDPACSRPRCIAEIVAARADGGASRSLGPEEFIEYEPMSGRRLSRPLSFGGMIAALFFCTASAHAESRISAVWANDGGDKVLREERRASGGLAVAPSGGITNAVWDGARISLAGARNEVVGFNLVIESAAGAKDVGVVFQRLDGPSGAAITTRPAKGDAVYDYRGRNIELFLLRYLQIKGLSRLSYDHYDERWVPSKMRRPFEVVRSGLSWKSAPVAGKDRFEHRPGSNRHFPEIAVPLEAAPAFAVPADGSQSVWVDVYIPRNVPPGTYAGALRITEAGAPDRAIPVSLQVRGFTLPDTPTGLAIAAIEPGDIAQRFLGPRVRHVERGSPAHDLMRPIMERHVQMLRRHGVVTMLDEAGGVAPPAPAAVARIKGTLYSAAKGYDGPGRDTADSVFFIGHYGSWAWKKSAQDVFNKQTDAWMAWFALNAPRATPILYLTDEPDLKEAAKAAEINGWIDKLWANPGIGRRLSTFITAPLPLAREKIPRVNELATWYGVADTGALEAARKAHLEADKRNRIWQYNGQRPASGSFAIEDDGTALRVVQWAAFKKGISGWFFWNATYYNDFQNGTGRTDVWRQAKPFGGTPRLDPVLGETGHNYSNGDGVLLYPGIDRIFPDAPAPGLEGPVASLRLKLWRRGIQDHAYLTLAAQKNPVATKAIVDRLVPKVLWEVGVANPRDPTYQHYPRGEDVGWSNKPDDWETARRQLADIIEGG